MLLTLSFSFVNGGIHTYRAHTYDRDKRREKESIKHTHLHHYGRTYDNERIYNMLKKIIFNIIFTFQNVVFFFSSFFSAGKM